MKGVGWRTTGGGSSTLTSMTNHRMRELPKDILEQVDWCFEHAKHVMREDASRKHAWHLQIHFRDILTMRRAARRLREDRYLVMTQDTYECVTIQGDKRTVSDLGPTATVFHVGAFKPAGVKKFVREMLALAAESKAKCDALERMSMSDMRMLFGPPSLLRTLPAAKWRLHHYTDTGLQPGAALVYVFGFETSSPAGTISALKKSGVKQAKRGPRDAMWNVEIRVPGANDDKALTEAFKVARQHAKTLKCKLVGVDFEEP